MQACQAADAKDYSSGPVLCHLPSGGPGFRQLVRTQQQSDHPEVEKLTVKGIKQMVSIESFKVLKLLSSLTVLTVS